jgi:hypothetical protein
MIAVEVAAGEIELHTVGGVVLLSTFCFGDDVEMTGRQAMELAAALLLAAADGPAEKAAVECGVVI